MNYLNNSKMKKTLIAFFISIIPFVGFSNIIMIIDTLNGKIIKNIGFNNEKIVIDMKSITSSKIEWINSGNEKLNIELQVLYNPTEIINLSLDKMDKKECILDFAKGRDGFSIQICRTNNSENYSTICFQTTPKDSNTETPVDKINQELENQGVDTIGEFRVKFCELSVYEWSDNRRHYDYKKHKLSVVESITADSIRLQYKLGLFNVIIYCGGNYYKGIYQSSTEDYTKQKYKIFTRLTSSQDKNRFIYINQPIYFQKWCEYVGQDFDQVIKKPSDKCFAKAYVIAERGINASINVYLSSDVLSLLGNEPNNLLHGNASIQIPIKTKPIFYNKVSIVDHVYADFNLRKFENSNGMVYLGGINGDSIMDRIDLLSQSQATFNVAINAVRFGNDFHRISLYGNLHGLATLTNVASIKTVQKADINNPSNTITTIDTSGISSLSTLSWGFDIFVRFRKSERIEMCLGLKKFWNFATSEEFQNGNSEPFYDIWSTLYLYNKNGKAGSLIFRYNLLLRKFVKDAAINSFEVGYSVKISDALKKFSHPN